MIALLQNMGPGLCEEVEIGASPILSALAVIDVVATVNGQHLGEPVAMLNSAVQAFLDKVQNIVNKEAVCNVLVVFNCL